MPCPTHRIVFVFPLARMHARLHAIKLSSRIFARKFSIFLRYFFGKSSFLPDFPNYGIILLYHTVTRYVKHFLENFTGFLALSLFVALALGANYHYSTVSFDYFALIAHRLYRRSYFHYTFSLLIKLFVVYLRLATPRDSSFRQIVRAHFQFYRIALYDSDVVHTELTGNIRRDGVTVGKLHFERCVGQRFDYLSFRFDYVVFGHRNFLRFFYLQKLLLFYFLQR